MIRVLSMAFPIEVGAVCSAQHLQHLNSDISTVGITDEQHHCARWQGFARTKTSAGLSAITDLTQAEGALLWTASPAETTNRDRARGNHEKTTWARVEKMNPPGMWPPGVGVLQQQQHEGQHHEKIQERQQRQSG